MRVITGIAKGHPLKSLKGIATRPTADKVKQALFNILGGSVCEAKVMDLYAGTGNLGIEALSRGASAAVFIEKNPAAVKIIHANLASTKLQANARVYQMDVFQALAFLALQGESFDLIFLDPPYQHNLVANTIAAVADYKLLGPDGILVAEHTVREPLNSQIGGLSLYRQAKYGDTLLSFYQSTEEIKNQG